MDGAGDPERRLARTERLPLEGGGRRAMSWLAGGMLRRRNAPETASQLILGAARWG